MITGIGIVSIDVENQQKSLKFWTDKVGLEVKANNPMTPEASWIEVAPTGALTALVLYPRLLMPNWRAKAACSFSMRQYRKNLQRSKVKRCEIHAGAEREAVDNLRDVCWH